MEVDQILQYAITLLLTPFAKQYSKLPFRGLCKIFGDDKPVVTEIANKIKSHINSDEELTGHTVLTFHEAIILLN